MSTRIGVIGITVEDREKAAPRINEILSSYADIIIGRMGLPYREKNLSIISLIIEGDTDRIGALSGKIGSIDGVKVKSSLISKDQE